MMANRAEIVPRRPNDARSIGRTPRLLRRSAAHNDRNAPVPTDGPGNPKLEARNAKQTQNPNDPTEQARRAPDGPKQSQFSRRHTPLRSVRLGRGGAPNKPNRAPVRPGTGARQTKPIWVAARPQEQPGRTPYGVTTNRANKANGPRGLARARVRQTKPIWPRRPRH